MSTTIGARSGLILDLRSEAYAALGPAPARADAVFVRVVTEQGGRRRALNHFNKAGKGALTRRRLLAPASITRTSAPLLAWARAEGVRLEPGAAGELDAGRLAARWHPTRWSSTRPADCMSAYIVVGPTKR